MKQKEEYFGSPGRIKEYRILFYVGLSLIIIGGILFVLEEIYRIAGIAFLFIGIMCAVSGVLGLDEEKKKQGLKIKSTTAGLIALTSGIGSAFLSNRGYMGIILGIIAIISAIIAVKKGDNQYGLAGGICGAIGISVNIYVWLLFTYFA